MHTASRRPAELHTGVGGGHDAVGETHAPRQQSGPAVITVAAEQAADAADGVADGGGRRANVKELEERKLKMARQKNERENSAQKAAEPGKAVARKEHGPRIGEKFARRFQHVVQAGTQEAGDARDGDDQKAFVLLRAFARL